MLGTADVVGARGARDALSADLGGPQQITSETASAVRPPSCGATDGWWNPWAGLPLPGGIRRGADGGPAWQVQETVGEAGGALSSRRDPV